MNLSKNATFMVTLRPSGRQIRASCGSILRKVLFKRNTEMPCGGHGECRGCKVKMLSGMTEPTETERARFKSQELAEGWRLSCQTKINSNIEIETRPWMEPCIRPEPNTNVPRSVAQFTLAYLAYSLVCRVFRKR